MIANTIEIFGDNLGEDLSQVQTPMTHQLVSLTPLHLWRNLTPFLKKNASFQLCEREGLLRLESVCACLIVLLLREKKLCSQRYKIRVFGLGSLSYAKKGVVELAVAVKVTMGPKVYSIAK